MLTYAKQLDLKRETVVEAYKNYSGLFSVSIQRYSLRAQFLVVRRNFPSGYPRHTVDYRLPSAIWLQDEIDAAFPTTTTVVPEIIQTRGSIICTRE